jgi:NADPH:quinone reductase-like Zn-dependent oxidoreductase
MQRRFMKAFVLVRHGEASRAFELREMEDPVPGPGQARVAVEMFGLNFADVMARLGLYRDTPPIPAVLGYAVVGRIDRVGEGMGTFREGMRVVAMTRFGGYAMMALATRHGLFEIPEDFDAATATALATQYVTAWYAAAELVRLHPGDRVLVQGAAGGVGTALVQIAKQHGCVVYGTTGSPDKMKHLREAGVDYPLCTAGSSFDSEYRRASGRKPLDVVFDSLGGSGVRKGLQLLGSGGRMVSYGVSSMVGSAHTLPSSVRTLLAFGFPHPLILLLQSKSLLAVNMLRIADDRPDIIQRCLQEVASRGVKGELRPVVGKVFPAREFAAAHEWLRERKSIGKVAVKW